MGSATGDDEALLWARAREGHGPSFGELFDRHQARVHRHATRLTEDAPCAP